MAGTPTPFESRLKLSIQNFQRSLNDRPSHDIPRLNLVSSGKHASGRSSPQPGSTPGCTTPTNPVEVDTPVDCRFVPDVPIPEAHQLTLKDLFDEEGNLLWRKLMLHLSREGKLDPSAVEDLVSRASALLREEKNVLELSSPMTVYGDIHGQFFDLINLVGSWPDPLDRQFLFLGDYVDRGNFSTEVLLLLFGLKVAYPRNVFLLRGNHECEMLSTFFNFKDECLHKYNLAIHECFLASFATLPLAATIATPHGTYFACHGGLSPSFASIDDINKIERKRCAGKNGPLCDILWSDPIEESSGRGLSADDMTEWLEVDLVPNPNRGCGQVFGYTAVQRFLAANGFKMMIRAHEVQRNGYHYHEFYDPLKRGHPLCVTLFSAPNYCGVYGNQGAYMNITDTEWKVMQFSGREHPFYLPKFMDGVTYTLPFVIENVTKLFVDVVEHICGSKDAHIRSKLKTVSRLRAMMTALRMERDDVIHRKIDEINLSPRGKNMSRFDIAKSIDLDIELGVAAVVGRVPHMATYNQNGEAMPTRSRYSL